MPDLRWNRAGLLWHPLPDCRAEAMRFVEGLTTLVNAMGNPSTLFKEVEALGFRHLDIEITSFLVQICPNITKHIKALMSY